MFNIHELASDNLQERIDHDQAICSDIFENGTNTTGAEIKQMIRLGKRPRRLNNNRGKRQETEEEKPRPLLVMPKEA